MTDQPASNFPEYWAERLGTSVRLTCAGLPVTGKVVHVDLYTKQITMQATNGHTYYVYGPHLQEIK